MLLDMLLPQVLQQVLRVTARVPWAEADEVAGGMAKHDRPGLEEAA